MAIVSTHSRGAFTPQLPEGQLTIYTTLPIAGFTHGEAGSRSRKLVFSRDERPVDGELRELMIVRKDSSTPPRCARHTSIASTRQEIDRTEELSSGLACSITDTEAICSRDNRSADGQRELVMTNR